MENFLVEARLPEIFAQGIGGGQSCGRDRWYGWSDDPNNVSKLVQSRAEEREHAIAFT